MVDINRFLQVFSYYSYILPSWQKNKYTKIVRAWHSFHFWSLFTKIFGDQIIALLKYQLPSNIEPYHLQKYINKLLFLNCVLNKNVTS